MLKVKVMFYNIPKAINDEIKLAITPIGIPLKKPLIWGRIVL